MYKGLKKEFRTFLHLVDSGKLYSNKAMFIGISDGKPYVEIQEYNYGNSSGKSSKGVTFYPNSMTHCLASNFFKAWDEYLKDDNNFNALIDLLAKQGGVYVTIWNNYIDVYYPSSGNREKLFKLDVSKQMTAAEFATLNGMGIDEIAEGLSPDAMLEVAVDGEKIKVRNGETEVISGTIYSLNW